MFLIFIYLENDPGGPFLPPPSLSWSSLSAIGFPVNIILIYWSELAAIMVYGFANKGDLLKS